MKAARIERNGAGIEKNGTGVAPGEIVDSDYNPVCWTCMKSTRIG